MSTSMKIFQVLIALMLAWSLAVTAGAGESQESSSNTQFVNEYCSTCHNAELQVGNFSLSNVNFDLPEAHAESLEKVILKLRAGMMPPAGVPHPKDIESAAFVEQLEKSIDLAALVSPNPGRPILHRLNRTEYKNSIRDLLDLEINVESLLPPDDMSEGFDNMSDVLTLSPTLLDGYIRAAGKISRLAVGDVSASPSVETYIVPQSLSQLDHVEGTPFGTRGGIAVRHNFPADGEYIFRINLYHRSLGPLFGDNKPAEGEQLEVSVNGKKVALFDIDRKRHTTEDIRTPPIFITAGPQMISASFIRRAEGAVQDFVMPFEQATADLTTGNVKGLTGLPHVKTLGVDGPYKARGVSSMPSHDKIFTCWPARSSEEVACAKTILSRLARQAFRRPITDQDLVSFVAMYQVNRDGGGDFYSAIRVSIQAILADPEFVFRFERTPPDVTPGENYFIDDLELASRLSFFLWSSGPDDELITLASKGKLSEPSNLKAQTRRMLADPKSIALTENFASHWLRLQNLKDIQPDVFLYPDWDYNLTQSMQKETVLFFNSIVNEDRNLLDLLMADYTFVDGRLALHYDIPNIIGNRFRRVFVEDENRRGLLGQASLLTLTSLANRTSPVIRGAWILDVLLGAPPPTPPADVPALEENEHGKKVLSVRERLETHRSNPACSACHAIMDPLGYALENFDPVGAWREQDGGSKIDPYGELFDGTEIAGPVDLRKFLLDNKVLFVTNFSRKLLMYGLGRVVKYYDMPAVRKIVDYTAKNDYRFSSFVLGVVQSVPFRMRRAEPHMAVTEP